MKSFYKATVFTAAMLASAGLGVNAEASEGQTCPPTITVTGTKAPPGGPPYTVTCYCSETCYIYNGLFCLPQGTKTYTTTLNKVMNPPPWTDFCAGSCDFNAPPC